MTFMSRKFQALRREIFAVFGCDPETVGIGALLPVMDGRVLDPPARLQRQARLYGLWERTQQIVLQDLDDAEGHELRALAEHLELCLSQLDPAGSEGWSR